MYEVFGDLCYDAGLQVLGQRRPQQAEERGAGHDHEIAVLSRPRGGAELARVLSGAGCDLLLCETFPLVEEGLVALEAALETERECWLSFTPGPRADLLTPAEIAGAARMAARAGAAAVLVNCVPIARALEFLLPLADALVGSNVALGCYANAGSPDERTGWTSAPVEPARYADAAGRWLEHGATILGGCCGTGPAHVRSLATRFAAGAYEPDPMGDDAPR